MVFAKDRFNFSYQTITNDMASRTTMGRKRILETGKNEKN